MQYMIELPNGDRRHVSEEFHMTAKIACEKNYQKIMHTDTLLVFRAHPPSSVPPVALHYGGRGRGYKNPVGYGGS